MKWRSALAAAAAAAAMSLAALPLTAQVGSLPEASPYHDLNDGQRFGFAVGFLSTGKDALGMAPKSGPLAGVRYDVFMGGPAYLSIRLLGASSDRRVLDPSKNAAQRDVGTHPAQLVDLDAALTLALTGARTWHSVQPLVNFGVGMASGVNDRKDVGGYTFGSKFSLSYGFGARYVTGKNLEMRADIGWFLWQINYPGNWRNSYSSDLTSVRSSGSLTPWTFNRAITVAATWGIFR